MFLEERLRSRFSWGLPVDIQPPNYETKVAILRKRAELDNIYIDDEIFDYIATHIKSNIRDLEGALNKINIFFSFRLTQASSQLLDKNNG